MSGALLLALGGCSNTWDAGGKRHWIGVGYHSMVIPDASLAAPVHGIDVTGVALIATRQTVGLVIGYGSDRVVTLQRDQAVALDCLHCDLAIANARLPENPKTERKQP